MFIIDCLLSQSSVDVLSESLNELKELQILNLKSIYKYIINN